MSGRRQRDLEQGLSIAISERAEVEAQFEAARAMADQIHDQAREILFWGVIGWVMLGEPWVMGVEWGNGSKGGDE